ncbi:MAG: sensor histidine kinase [Thiolinea sp.]
MKRILHYLALAAVLVISIGLLVFLYTKSQGVDNYAYGRVNYNLRMLKQMDIEWDALVSGSVNRKQIATDLPETEKLFSALKRDLGHLSAQVDGNATIMPELEKYEQAVAKKQQFIRQVNNADTGVLQKFEKLTTIELNKKLSQLANQHFSHQLIEQNTYRQYLMIYSGFLLLLVFYAIYRLIKAALYLRQANKKLVRQEIVRDQELAQALTDLKDTQAQLIHAERMTSLGQMMAGITHEINTPLTYVKSGMEIINSHMVSITELQQANLTLKQSLDDDSGKEENIADSLQQVSELSVALADAEIIEETQELLTDSLHGMEEITEIIGSLKNFSRLDRDKVRQFNVNDGLESTLKIARHLLKGRHLEKDYADVADIHCFPSAVNQVFLNLISNAVQATPQGGLIRIVTRSHNDFVRIQIADDGPGISGEAMSKMFEPFFTTKAAGQGTGLGLAIVKRIIDEHEGDISVESVEGQGTCFTVDLPIQVAFMEAA